MSATPGYNGYIKIGTNYIGNIKSDTFDLETVMDDITAMNNTGTPSPFKSFLPGLSQATFSMSANWDLTDTNGQLAMQNAYFAVPPTLLNFTLTPNNGTNTYSFSAYVKKIGLKNDVAKPNDVTYDMQPTGPITRT